MSSPPTIEPFNGTTWEECNDFIRAVRTAAWKEGKFRDLAWVADFAALHFSHEALRWHSQLPKAVRQDWEKLEAALLNRWAPLKYGNEPQTEPTPAAAPSTNRGDTADHPLQGVLKIVTDGSNTNSYFKLDEDGCGVLTNNVNHALRVRCISLSNATLLERTDGSRHSWLGVQWGTGNPDLKSGSTAYGFLVLVHSSSLKSSWEEHGYPYQLASCSISTNREVIPFWENNDSTRIRFGTFNNSGLLCLAADPDAYSKKYPDEKRAKIFIEPVDESGWGHLLGRFQARFFQGVL